MRASSPAPSQSQPSGFLAGFVRRGGLAVFGSGVAVKVISLLVAIFVARVLDREVYGSISYAVVLVTAIIPFASSALPRTLLRYGAFTRGEPEQAGLFAKLFRWGLVVAISAAVLVFLGADFLCANQPRSTGFLRILTLLFVSDFLFEILQIRLRLQKKNRTFALTGLARSLLLITCTVTLLAATGPAGYAIALAIAPLLAAALFARCFPRPAKCEPVPLPAKNRELWYFGSMVGLSTLTSRLQFYLDGIMVGNLIPDPAALALYRIATLLPLNLMFLPQVFFKSEYVHIAEHHDRKAFVRRYLGRYGLLSLAVSAAAIAVAALFGDLILGLVFGPKYRSGGDLLTILMVGLAGSFMLKRPFGVLLNIAGKAGLNVAIGLVTTAVSILLFFSLIPRFGLPGAAAGTALTAWISGFISAAAYYHAVYRKLA